MQRSNALKIAFISDHDYGTYNFRMQLFRQFDREGWEVYVLVGHGNYTEKFKEGNIKVIAYDIKRKSLNPLLEIKTLFQIYKILRKIRPDIVHTFGIKPNVYGSISARALKIKYIINTVTGLGSMFIQQKKKDFFIAALRKFMELLLRITSKFATKVIFLNENDAEYLCSRNIISKHKILIINGEGIDVDLYSISHIKQNEINLLKEEFNINSNKIIFTMISRLILFKGVKEYCEAAKQIKKQYDAEFLLVGNIDYDNPFPIKEDYLKQHVNEGSIKWLGFRTDIKEILYISDVFVLPSYREGIPISILEAMSMRKPIITTNVPGCRQIVQDGVNGLLVSVNDSVALAKAMEKFILDKNLSERLGKDNREKIIKDFSKESILSALKCLYEDILAVKN